MSEMICALKKNGSSGGTTEFTMVVGGSSVYGGYAAISTDFVEQFTTIVATRDYGSSNCQIGNTTITTNTTIPVASILGQTTTSYGGIETYLFYVINGGSRWAFKFS